MALLSLVFDYQTFNIKNRSLGPCPYHMLVVTNTSGITNQMIVSMFIPANNITSES
jgi:hypothetical protein